MDSKCGFVAIIGAPNAGKSTLTNLLVGGKVTIVSPKVQTTRGSVRGIMVEGKTQLIFCDTPGIFKAEGKLEKAIVTHAMEQISQDMDIVLLVDAAKQNKKAVAIILEQLRFLNKKVILALNKIDLVSKGNLLPIMKYYEETNLFSEIFLISASNNDGIDDLKKVIIERAPASPFLYPEDQLTDVSSRFLAQEITREKLFIALKDELPYNLSVETDSWKEAENGKVTIDQTIYINKEGQKKIIIGSKGQMIKEVGTQARKELEEIFATRINLYLHVKVKPDWLDKPYMYTHMGLKYPKK
ncbi:MAG: GTPase Era [Alphaproteobacteria bacterium]|jgi:GTPase|nr:GTPase Era [Alphaproteobacteria bacterium]MBT5828115.1 GTPase Era [Alphaproteobacteria bacterium]